jgi:hypothetical protein
MKTVLKCLAAMAILWVVTAVLDGFKIEIRILAWAFISLAYSAYQLAKTVDRLEKRICYLEDRKQSDE